MGNDACGGNLRRPAPAERDSFTGVTGEIYGGLAYDHDAAGALALQSDFFGSAKRDDGFSLISGARLAMRSLGYAGSGGFYGGFALTSKHDLSGPRHAGCFDRGAWIDVRRRGRARCGPDYGS